MKRTYGLADSIFAEMEKESILDLGKYYLRALRSYAQRLGIRKAPRIRGGKMPLLAAIQDRRLERQKEAEILVGRRAPMSCRVAVLENKLKLLLKFATLSREEAATATRIANDYVMASIGKVGYSLAAALQDARDHLDPLRNELNKMEKELEGLL